MIYVCGNISYLLIKVRHQFFFNNIFLKKFSLGFFQSDTNEQHKQQ